jgi:2-dehydropantoate 2-reductase
VSDRVVVVGGGAMGGAFAAMLASAGSSTAIVDVAPAVIEAVRRDGLRVTDADGERSVPMDITDDPATLGPADIVLIFVKATHTRSATASLRPLVGPGTVVASLQNGWGNADVLADVVPRDQLVVGVTYHSATVAEPGHVRHTFRAPTFVGPYGDGGSMAGAEHVAAALRSAGLEVTATPTVKTEIWKKLVLNAATLPTSSLTGTVTGRMGAPGLVEVVDELARETVRVARAQGYDIDEAERLERIHTVIANGGTGRSSMLQDAVAHRLTEIDTICGAVTRAADAHDVPAPLNRAMVGLVHALERSWTAEE